MEEEWRTLDAVNSIQHESKESSLPMDPAAIMLSTSDPHTLSAFPTSAVPPRQPLDDQMPPVKVINR